MPVKRLPLFVQTANRAGSETIDAQLLNGLVEKDANGELWCYKRPAFVNPFNLGFSGIQFFGQSQFGYVAASAAEMICNGVAQTGSYGTILGGDSTGDGSQYYILTSSGGFLFNGSAWSSSGAPTSVLGKSFVPGVVQLDQTFYAMDSAGGVYASNVNDTSTWPNTNLIYANSYPGQAIALGRQLAYLLAFKQYDIEVFYDAANSAGSPLAAVPAQRILWGAVSSASIAVADDTILWLAQSNSGEMFISSMKNLAAAKISIPAIDRILVHYAQLAGVAYQGVAVKVMGHRLYLLQLTATGQAGITLVYDIDLKVWMTWNLPATIVPFGINAGAVTEICTNTGAVLNLSQSTAVDYTGTVYPYQLTTPPFDGGSRNYKYCPRMDVLTDNTPAKDLQVRWSDNDQVTWTNWRNVSLASSRPTLTGCGRFRRRTFQFNYSGASALRLQAVDLHVEEGTL